MTKTPTPSFADLERRGWSEPETALAYANDFAKAAEYSVPVMLDLVGAKQGCDLLDLCCGQGILSAGAIARGATVTGIDFSPAMLDLARARVPDASFVQGDAMHLGGPSARYDAVVIGFGIPHVPDAERVFEEVRRVLKPGGRFAYSVWQNKAGAMQYMFEAIAEHGAKGIALPPGPGAHDFADQVRASEALNTAGFSGVSFTEVDSRWMIKSPEQIFQFFEEGTVRGAAMLRAQPEENRQAIRTALSDLVMASHGSGPVWNVPLPSIVVSACVP